MHRFRKTREIAYFNNNLLVHAPNDVNAQHAGIEKCKWLRAGTPALIPLFEKVPRLHTVIEISLKTLQIFRFRMLGF